MKPLPSDTGSETKLTIEIKEIKMENSTSEQLLKNTSLNKSFSYLVASVKRSLVDMRAYSKKYYEACLGMRVGSDVTPVLSRAQANFQFVHHCGPLFVAPLMDGSLVLSADLNDFILQVRTADNQTKPHQDQECDFSMYYAGRHEGNDIYMGFNDGSVIIEAYDQSQKRKVFRIYKNVEDVYYCTPYTEHILAALLMHYVQTGILLVSCEDTSYSLLADTDFVTTE